MAEGTLRRSLPMALLIASALAPHSRSQGLGAAPGSTAPGDYLRGVGVAAYGLGLFNELSAEANRINTETSIMANEYMWNVAKYENLENARTRRERLKAAAERYRQIQERIRDNPEALDVMDGAALNAKLLELHKPVVSESTSRFQGVPLNSDWIQVTPFKLGGSNLVFSMSRLSVKKRWAVAFQDPRFDRLRERYQKAVDNAMDLAIEHKMEDAAIDAIIAAVEDLQGEIDRNPNLSDAKRQLEYAQAKTQLKTLSATIKIFQDGPLQDVFADLAKYSGTTVDELRLCMQKHALTFGKAETPEERDKFPRLYTALSEQAKLSEPK
jgi:hypothetical protein